MTLEGIPMSAPLDCPGMECWQAVLNDTVPPEQREHYERHLESCPVCQERMDQTGECGDKMRQLVRRVGEETVSVMTHRYQFDIHAAGPHAAIPGGGRRDTPGHARTLSPRLASVMS